MNLVDLYAYYESVEHISDRVTENETVVTGEFHDSHEVLGAGVDHSVGTTPKHDKNYNYNIV